MRSSKKSFAAIAAIALTFGLTAQADAEQKDIVDTAVGAGSFKTLAAALQAADLVDTLKGDGPFTVFAPTDEAFAKLPKGTVETLLKPENKGQLVAVLTYHVVAGKVPAAKVVKLTTAKTVNGQSVDVKVADGKVMVDGANVVATDIECSNGVIHVIDSVILPSADDTAASEPHKAIEEAVARGSRLYNDGHVAQCALHYAKTMRTMLDTENHGMNEKVVHAMHSSLARAEQTHCNDSRAWTLRKGLETAYHAMTEDIVHTASNR